MAPAWALPPWLLPRVVVALPRVVLARVVMRVVVRVVAWMVVKVRVLVNVRVVVKVGLVVKVSVTCKRNPVVPLQVAHPVMHAARFVGRVGPHSHLALKGWSGLPGPISVNSPSCLWRLWHKAIASFHHRGVQSLGVLG